MPYVTNPAIESLAAEDLYNPHVYRGEPKHAKAVAERVRDTDAPCTVYRCPYTDIIFLGDDKRTLGNYPERADAYTAAAKADTQRRGAYIEGALQAGPWLDIGAGSGGLLLWAAMAYRECTDRMFAVDPGGAPDMSNWPGRVRPRWFLTTKKMVPEWENQFRMVTLFHTLEHMDAPVAELRRVFRLLRDGGTVVVEVPHARDALIVQYDNERFRKHTFWSEHLVLYTRALLGALLQHVGFRGVRVFGVQRHGWANHASWLAGPDADHNIAFFAGEERQNMERAYSRFLEKADLTDTIIAVGTK